MFGFITQRIVMQAQYLQWHCCLSMSAALMICGFWLLEHDL